MIEAAKRALVPVCVNFDHGLTYERCLEALQLGFTGVMFDGSAGSYADNLRKTREIVKLAHEFGAGVEGETGHVGEAASEDNLSTDRYTTPEEAVRFIEETGVDALAVAVGTAHGAYKEKPCLDIGRLRMISDAVDTPLVLHGGSGLSDQDFRNTIANGISKVNIFTDLCLAGEKAMEENKGAGYLEIRHAKVQAIKEAVKTKIRLFGSCGKAADFE